MAPRPLVCDLCGLQVTPDQEAIILNRFVVLAPPDEPGDEEKAAIGYFEPSKEAPYTWEPKGGVVTGLILHAETCLSEGLSMKIGEARALGTKSEGHDPWQL